MATVLSAMSVTNVVAMLAKKIAKISPLKIGALPHYSKRQFIAINLDDHSLYGAICRDNIDMVKGFLKYSRTKDEVEHYHFEAAQSVEIMQLLEEYTNQDISKMLFNGNHYLHHAVSEPLISNNLLRYAVNKGIFPHESTKNNLDSLWHSLLKYNAIYSFTNNELHDRVQLLHEWKIPATYINTHYISAIEILEIQIKNIEKDLQREEELQKEYEKNGALNISIDDIYYFKLRAKQREFQGVSEKNASLTCDLKKAQLLLKLMQDKNFVTEKTHKE